MKATLPVVELFGPTIQGEGPHTGRRAVFLRSGNCNLHCTWCDSWYTWDDERGRAPEVDMDGAALLARIEELEGETPALLILTGGEPLMHQGTEAVRELVQARQGVAPIAVETNGTIPPLPHMVEGVDLFCVSPKLNYQGDPEKLRIKRRPLEAFAALAEQGRAIFKVVCEDIEQVHHALAITDRYGVDRRHVWIMPEGTEAEVVVSRAREMVDLVLAEGANLTLRNHVLLWGDERER